MDEEWRVSLIACVQMAGGKPVSANAIRDALRGRVDADTSVTAGKAGIFLYAATADAAAAAEGVTRAVLAEQGVAAEARIERWDPPRRTWLPADGAAAAEPQSEPPPGPERNPGRKRLRAAGAVIAAIMEGMGSG